MRQTTPPPTAEEVADRLGGKKKKGHGFMAFCPSHDDSTGSLSLDDGDKGLLFKCFAGCEQKDVLEALISCGALPDDRKQKTAAPTKKKASKKTTKKKTTRPSRGKIVAEYDYVSPDGELLFQCVRKEPKTFLQRQPNGKGGWKWNLEGVSLVPFALPELLAAIKNNKFIFIVEGEKDVLALQAMKPPVTATCCPMGAGSWRSEFNSYFTNANVIVIPDNDEPGKEHAKRVCLELQNTAHTIRYMELPGLSDHGDLSDWVDAGGTREHLNKLVKAIKDEPLRFADDPAPRPLAGGHSEKPKAKLGVVEASGAVRAPAPREQPEQILAMDHLDAVWEKLNLVRNNNNRPISNMDNALRVIEGHEKIAGKIFYDEFYDAIRTTWGGERVTPWKDEDTRRLTLVMQREIAIRGMTTSVVFDAVLTAAHRNVKNEPREWMDTLEWDNKRRLRDLMFKGFGARDNEYTQAVGRCWIMSMCARVLRPGCKADYMPVFEGPQGAYKSSALGVIGGKWFMECHEPVTSKDFYQVMRGAMLIEISELHAFRRAEVERIKGIITCRVDKYRKSYARIAEDHPRMSVFAGTTNVDDWNADETGARRFWPVAVRHVDLQWLEDNREQLFAEAVFLVNDGEPWWDFPEEFASQEQELRRKTDEWEGLLLRYFKQSRSGMPHENYWNDRLEPLTETTVADCLEYALGIDPARWSRGDQMRVAGALKAVGWRRRRFDSKWRYVGPDHQRY